MTVQYGFEQVLDEDGNLLWIGARAKANPRRFFVYVPNTGKWHRYPELEPGAGYVEGVQFKATSSRDVVKKLPALKKIDERSLGWVVDEFRAQKQSEILSTSDLGLPAGKGAKRPTTQVDIIELAPDTWITLAHYDTSKHRAAIAMASDIRRGKKKNLLGGVTKMPGEIVISKKTGQKPFKIESRVQQAEQGYDVEIRKTRWLSEG